MIFGHEVLEFVGGGGWGEVEIRLACKVAPAVSVGAAALLDIACLARRSSPLIVRFIFHLMTTFQTALSQLLELLRFKSALSNPARTGMALERMDAPWTRNSYI